MKTGRIAEDAFAYYLSLGEARSYAAVAKKYVVSKRAVTARATKERWAERLATTLSKATERRDEDALESFVQMTLRHNKVLRAMTSKALETLRAMPLETAMDAVRTLDIVLKQERAARGEPEGDTKAEVEALIRREGERWFEPEKDAKETEVAGVQDGR